MIRWKTPMIGVVVTLVATALAALTLAPPSLGGDRETRSETITLHDTTTATAFVDLNHDMAPEPGDSLLFHEEYRRSATLIEFNDSQCLVALGDTYLCHVVVTVVSRGEIDLAGSVRAPGGAFPGDFDIAITGGTGDFARARGYGHVHQTGDTTADDTLVIRP